MPHEINDAGTCTSCGGSTTSLPRECPGAPLTADERDQVVAGLLDYRDGEWRVPVFRGGPFVARGW